MSRRMPAFGYRALAWVRRHPIASGIIGVFVLLLLIGSLASPPKGETPTSSPVKATISPTPTVSATPSPAPSSASPSPTTPTVVGSTAPGSAGSTVVTQPFTPAPAPPVQQAPPPAQQQAPPAQQAPPPAQQAPVQQQAAQPAAAQAPAQQAPPPADPQPASAYYENCTEARAAGAAPIYEGQPGYSTKLDRDRDGVACE